MSHKELGLSQAEYVALKGCEEFTAIEVHRVTKVSPEHAGVILRSLRGKGFIQFKEKRGKFYVYERIEG